MNAIQTGTLFITVHCHHVYLTDLQFIYCGFQSDNFSTLWTIKTHIVVIIIIKLVNLNKDMKRRSTWSWGWTFLMEAAACSSQREQGSDCWAPSSAFWQLVNQCQDPESVSCLWGMEM